MRKAQVRTDWPGLLLSSVVPVVAFAGFAWAAMQSSSWEEGPGWDWGFISLVPLEGLRVVAMRIAAYSYKAHLGPLQAIVFFPYIMVLVAGFILVELLLWRRQNTLTLHDLDVVLSNPFVWQAILVPTAIVVTDAALGLLLFRGDARVQAVRVEAVATTSGFWLEVALLYPVICIMAAFALVLAFGSPLFIDAIYAHLRVILCLCAALYFAGKALLLAYLHTERFMRTGHLPVLRDSQKAVDERRAVLLGEFPPTLREPVERQRK